MISLITMLSLERKVYGISSWLCSLFLFMTELLHCSDVLCCKQGVDISINLIPTKDGG